MRARTGEKHQRDHLARNRAIRLLLSATAPASLDGGAADPGRGCALSCFPDLPSIKHPRGEIWPGTVVVTVIIKSLRQVKSALPAVPGSMRIKPQWYRHPSRTRRE